MGETLRVAVIGYGLAGAVFHAPLVDATPGMRVSAIVTGNRERQASARAAYPEASIVESADALWADAGSYDLVVIGTPNSSHVSLGMASLAAGIPAVIDKPLASSVDGARMLIEESERRGVPITVFQNRRWDGDFLTIQQLIADDMLGPIVRFESRFERYRPVPKAGAWRERPEPEEAGGLLFDLGSHLIDQAVVLFGPPVSVYAEVNVRRPGALVDDDTFVALQFAGGEVAHLWMNTVVRLLGPRFHVSGLRGSYRISGLDPQEDALKAGVRPGDPTWGRRPREQWGELSTQAGGLHIEGAVEPLPGGYETFYAGVRDALRGIAPMPVDPRESLSVLEIIEHAKRSAAERRVIETRPL